MNAKNSLLIAAFVFAVCVASTAQAFMIGHSEGDWPDTWPAELEPLREQAETWIGPIGEYSTLYAIPFTSREQFEDAWPHLLAVLGKNATITFADSSATYVSDVDDEHPRAKALLTCNVTVRQYTAPDGTARWGVFPHYRGSIERSENGELRRSSPPRIVDMDDAFLDSLIKLGELRKIETEAGIAYEHQPEVNLILKVDGDIVDPDRIEIPEGFVIEDRRTNGD